MTSRRRAMLADVSHELRTPLTIIQGNIEAILDGVYPADEARLKSLLEETQILSRLVEDLRTLALAESGALQLKREPTDVAALIRETVSVFQSQADAADVKMELSLSDKPISLEIDPERIRQVLTNLISNALRYSPRGSSIKVDLTESARQSRNDALRFPLKIAVPASHPKICRMSLIVFINQAIRAAWDWAYPLRNISLRRMAARSKLKVRKAEGRRFGFPFPLKSLVK